MVDKNSNLRVWSLNLITSPLHDVSFHRAKLMEKPEFGLEGFGWVKKWWLTFQMMLLYIGNFRGGKILEYFREVR